ncbi:hypothetical protein ACFV2L_39640 [Streptomyces sp. NPDC059687]|uniref:hypothetical protein n=1 Tax=unclassified Streptomyces TaxID=2593676 RepID=UPI003435CEEC
MASLPVRTQAASGIASAWTIRRRTLAVDAEGHLGVRRDVRCSSIHRPRSTAPPIIPGLVGDGAHAKTPDREQGAWTSILDAGALPRAVAENSPAERPAALSAYDSECRRNARPVSFGSRNLHRFMTIRSGWTGEGR